MSDYELKQGDALTVLRGMPSESVQCCVTSPPYFGLRSYLDNGDPNEALEIGKEETPMAYVAKLVEVFAEVRRVLRDDGTLWLNLGDSYAQGGSGGASSKSTLKNDGRALIGARNAEQQLNRVAFSRKAPAGLKPKDRMGIPHRLVFALQDAGWWWRDEIVWHKPNPMPESVTDRTTKAHEFMFLLTKSAQYFYDAAAIAEPVAREFWNETVGREYMTAKDGRLDGGKRKGSGPMDGTRNKRSVWSVSSKPYAEAHFATYPPKLIEPCILAGSRVGDTVLDTFNGSGTTGSVALGHGRNYIGIELNPAYIKLAHDRINGTQPRLMFEQVSP